MAASDTDPTAPAVLAAPPDPDAPQIPWAEVKAVHGLLVIRWLKLDPSPRRLERFRCPWCAHPDGLAPFATGGVHCYACKCTQTNVDLVRTVRRVKTLDAVVAIAKHFECGDYTSKRAHRRRRANKALDDLAGRPSRVRLHATPLPVTAPAPVQAREPKRLIPRAARRRPPGASTPEEPTAPAAAVADAPQVDIPAATASAERQAHAVVAAPLSPPTAPTSAPIEVPARPSPMASRAARGQPGRLALPPSTVQPIDATPSRTRDTGRAMFGSDDRLGRYLDEVVYPALAARLDVAFPEFRFVMKRGRWVATDRAYTKQHWDARPDAVDCDPRKPWGFIVAGRGFHRWIDYVAGGRSLRGRAFVDAARRLCDLASVAFPERQRTREEDEAARRADRRRAILETVYDAAERLLWSDAGAHARAYLTDVRGFTEAHLRQLHLGFYDSVEAMRERLVRGGYDAAEAKQVGALWPQLAGYIVVPWRDHLGRAATISTRWPGTPPDGQPKALTLPGEGTKASPLFLDRARECGLDELVLVEGPFDAARLQVLGESHVIASTGAQLGHAQVATLARVRVRSVTIVPDPGEPGLKGAMGSVNELLAAGIKVYVTPRPPDDLDPDAFVRRDGLAGWTAHLARAVPGALFVAARLTGRITPKDTAPVRRAAVDRVMEYLVTLPGPAVALDRDDILRMLAKRTGYTAEALTQLAERAAARYAGQEAAREAARAAAAGRAPDRTPTSTS